jgi:hypothetical protein
VPTTTTTTTTTIIIRTTTTTTTTTTTIIGAHALQVEKLTKNTPWGTFQRKFVAIHC